MPIPVDAARGMANVVSLEHHRLVSTSPSPVDHLLLLKSDTPAKLGFYRLIAEAYGRQHGVRIEVRAMKELGDFRSPVEDGIDRKENGEKKKRELLNALEHLHAATPSGMAASKRLKRWLDESGIVFRTKPYDLNRITGIIDDITTAIGAGTYETMKPVLTAEITEGHYRAVRDKGNPGYLSVTDIAYVFSVLGPDRFFNLLREGSRATGEEASIYHQCLAIAATLSAPDESMVVRSDKQQKLYLHAPDGLDQPLRKANAVLPEPEHFLCAEPGGPPVAEDIVTYLSDPAGNARCKAVWDILDTIIAPAPKPKPQQTFPVAAQAATNPRVPPLGNHPKLAYIGFGAPPPKHIGGVPLVDVTLDPENYKVEDLINAHSMRFGLRAKSPDGSTLLETPDGLIIGPYDPQNQAQRVYMNGMKGASGVWRQTESSAARGSVIVFNYRGCHDDGFNAQMAATVNGMSNDTRRFDRFAMPGAGQHHAFHFQDWLTGDHLDEMFGGARTVWEQRLAGHCRLTVEERPYYRHPASLPLPVGMFKLSLVMSASSHALRPTNDVIEVSRFAARQNMALVTGGGGEGFMGASVVSYRDEGGPYLWNISTHTLIRIESPEGHLPEGKRGELYPHIGNRAFEVVMAGDVCASYPGGIGTCGQEDAIALQLHLTQSELMRDKKLAFIGSDSTKMLYLKAMLGRDDAASLIRHGRLDAGLDIFHFASNKTFLPRLAGWQRDHDIALPREGLLQTPGRVQANAFVMK